MCGLEVYVASSRKVSENSNLLFQYGNPHYKRESNKKGFRDWQSRVLEQLGPLVALWTERIAHQGWVNASGEFFFLNQLTDSCVKKVISSSVQRRVVR
jgi:hypothetical protein